MKRKFLFPRIDLQLFADGAGDGGTGSAGNPGVTAAAAGQHKGSNPLADVIYGKQPEAEAPPAEVQEQKAEPEVKPDRNAEFEKLIKGEYKDLYDARVQDTVQRRLRGSKETVEKYNALAPMLEMLGKKYGVDATDVNAIMKAVEDDDSYYEQEASERGMSVEHYKQMRKIQSENEALRKQMNERETKENADRLYADWMRQADVIKGVYPSFDLRAELQNDSFVQLLRSNVPMQTAYEVVHKDEILPAAMQFAVKETQSKIAKSIASGGSRPSENGMRSQAAALHKPNVSQFTKEDRAEILRRVARGEKIYL